MNRISLVTIAAMILGAAAFNGCSQEVEHHESDKPNMIGSGRTHEEKTVYRNPDGTYTTEHSKTRTSD